MDRNHKRRIRIGYVSRSDPNDKRAWSGTIYYMKVALQSYCGEIVDLGPVVPRLKLIAYRIDRIIYFLLRRKLNLEKSRWVSQEYNAIFTRKIKENDLDILFSPNPIEIAYLDTTLPIVYTKDSTGILMRDYDGQAQLFEWGYDEWDNNVRKALMKANLILMSSQWAASSVDKHYGISKEKICIIPYGANISEIPRSIDIKRDKADKLVCKLLFVGVDWQRKGGKIAYAAMKHLHELGILATLTICGCTPPQQIVDDSRVTLHKFLDKSVSDDLNKIVELYKSSHFLIFPTRAECYGIVVCEASAFGTPTIAADTGGVSGAVTDGVNGFLLPYDAGGNEYATKILQIFQDEEMYYKLCESSRKIYEEKLNWHAWGKAVAEKIETLNLHN